MIRGQPVFFINKVYAEDYPKEDPPEKNVHYLWRDKLRKCFHWEIPLQDNVYQDAGRAYAMSLNQPHHFKVILNTNDQKYCAFIDEHALAVDAPFDDQQARDFYTLGLGTFDTSTAEIGFDNILIQALPGICLPGVNLLLLD